MRIRARSFFHRSSPASCSSMTMMMIRCERGRIFIQDIPSCSFLLVVFSLFWLHALTLNWSSSKPWYIVARPIGYARNSKEPTNRPPSIPPSPCIVFLSVCVFTALELKVSSVSACIFSPLGRRTLTPPSPICGYSERRPQPQRNDKSAVAREMRRRKKG